MADKEIKSSRGPFGIFPWGKIAFCLLVVYVSVASNYLSLDKAEASFLLTHPAAHAMLVFFLALFTVHEAGQRWWISISSAAVVSGLFYLLAHFH